MGAGLQPPEAAVDLTVGVVVAVGIRKYVLDSRCAPRRSLVSRSSTTRQTDGRPSSPGRFVGSASMVPSLEPGDYFLLDRLTLRIRPPSRGEVVCFSAPPALAKDYPRGACFVKRVVALGGDVVGVRGGGLYINGVRQSEAYLDKAMSYSMPPTPVPSGHVFVMGDNRDDSADSHLWGPLAAERITGRVLCTHWPPNRACLAAAYSAVRSTRPSLKLRLSRSLEAPRVAFERQFQLRFSGVRSGE